MRPQVSIITVNLNNRAGLERTIRSVVTQSFRAFEFLIIDGGSTDGSRELIEAYAVDLTYWVSERDGGIYAAMNKGIRQARGQYCLFLNSGDWLVEDALATILPQCQNADILYCNTYLSYHDGQIEAHRYGPTLTMQHFYKGTIGHQSTLIHRRLFQTYGLYNENNRVHSDYEFWIKAIILGNCQCRHIDAFLSYYDMGGISSAADRSANQEVSQILTSHLPSRVLADYERWYALNQDIKLFNWMKSKAVLYHFFQFLFNLAKGVSSLRKSLT